jgi:hypothetical protein
VDAARATAVSLPGARARRRRARKRRAERRTIMDTTGSRQQGWRPPSRVLRGKSAKCSDVAVDSCSSAAASRRVLSSSSSKLLNSLCASPQKQSAGPAAVRHVSRGRQECVRSCCAQGLLQRGARAPSCTKGARASWKHIWNLAEIRNLARHRSNSRWAAGASPLHLDVELLFDASRVHVHGVHRQSNAGCQSPNAAGLSPNAAGGPTRPTLRDAGTQEAGTAGARPCLGFSCADCARLDALSAGARLDRACSPERDVTVSRGQPQPVSLTEG